MGTKYSQCAKMVKWRLPSIQTNLKFAIYSLCVFSKIIAIINNPLCSNALLSPEYKQNCEKYFDDPAKVYQMYYFFQLSSALFEGHIINFGLNKLIIYSLAINDFMLNSFFNLPQLNPEQVLPKNVLQSLITFLDHKSLAQIPCLSKKWKHIADDSFQIINNIKKIPMTKGMTAKISYVNFHKKYLPPSRSEKWQYDLSKIDFYSMFKRIIFQIPNQIDYSQPNDAEAANFQSDITVADQARRARVTTLLEKQRQRETSILNRTICELGFFAGKIVDSLLSRGLRRCKANLSLRAESSPRI